MTETGAARVTIKLNGQMIHDDVRLSLRRNKYGAFPEEKTSAIILQDHNSPVKFRNIWVVKAQTGINQKDAPEIIDGVDLNRLYQLRKL